MQPLQPNLKELHARYSSHLSFSGLAKYEHLFIQNKSLSGLYEELEKINKALKNVKQRPSESDKTKLTTRVAEILLSIHAIHNPKKELQGDEEEVDEEKEDFELVDKSEAVEAETRLLHPSDPEPDLLTKGFKEKLKIEDDHFGGNKK